MVSFPSPIYFGLTSESFLVVRARICTHVYFCNALFNTSHPPLFIIILCTYTYALLLYLHRYNNVQVAYKHVLFCYCSHSALSSLTIIFRVTRLVSQYFPKLFVHPLRLTFRITVKYIHKKYHIVRRYTFYYPA